MPLTYLELQDSGDKRGRSYGVPEESFAEGFCVRDAHITTLLPEHTRGDHFHRQRHEILIVTYADAWSLFWDDGGGGTANHREFAGEGTVVIRVPPMASHAIRNDGLATLHIVGLSDGPFDPAAPDIFGRKVSLP